MLGPLVTIGVALQAFGALADRFDGVSRRGSDQALALELLASVVAVAIVVTLVLQAAPARWLGDRLGLLEPADEPPVGPEPPALVAR